jgi:hypothetical protein
MNQEVAMLEIVGQRRQQLELSCVDPYKRERKKEESERVA